MQPPQIKRILFATDFLAGSRLALDYAVAFGCHFRATIIMVHALELPHPAQEAETETRVPSLSRKHAQERLDAIANGVRDIGINVEHFWRRAYPPTSFRPRSKDTPRIYRCWAPTRASETDAPADRLEY